jgi:DNA repair exonuclease SbcCD ATPase subunit
LRDVAGWRRNSSNLSPLACRLRGGFANKRPRGSGALVPIAGRALYNESQTGPAGFTFFLKSQGDGLVLPNAGRRWERALKADSLFIVFVGIMARGIPKPYSAQLTNVIVIKQEGSPTMALTATLSELYGAFRRKAGRAAQGMGIADTRFSTTDEKLDALNPAMEQRLNGLSQPFEGLKRELDQRSDALTQAMEQRLEVLSRATDQRLGAFGQTMDQRFDALSQRFDEHGQAFEELKRELDQRSEALNQSMDHRFDALSKRFDVVKQPFDELKRELDERFDARDQALEQRFDAVSGRFDGLNQAFRELGRALEQLTDALGHSHRSLDALSQRFDEHGQAFDELKRELHQRSEAQRFVGMEVQLARLETNVARMLERQRYLWWTLGILLALMLGFGAKAIFDWQTPMTFRSLWQNWLWPFAY